VAAVRAAARGAQLVWLCSPNNPTGLAEPDRGIESLLDGLAIDARIDGRPEPAVVLDEAYAEFVGRSLAGLRSGYPRLVVVRTASKAYGMAGLRVGFAIAQRETLAEIEPTLAGLIATTSVSRDQALARALANTAAIDRGAIPPSARRPGGPSVRRSPATCRRLQLPGSRIAEGLRRGLVPRTFGAGVRPAPA
jgi:histidinol-phosphate/aromatic aminotransferase/cobyric acid decarboxylase-like protein